MLASNLNEGPTIGSGGNNEYVPGYFSSSIYDQQSKNADLFKEAMSREGLVCLDTIQVTTGSVPVRFKNHGKGNADCWYFWDGTMGAFGDWHDSGKKTTWSAYDSYAHEWTERQKEDYKVKKQQQEEKARKHLREIEKKQKDISDQLSVQWANFTFSSQSDPEYQYLIDKKVVGYGIKYGRDQFGCFAAVPLIDINGTLYNMQKIYNLKADGSNNKWFLPGARKQGCFHIMGQPLGSLKEEDIVYVCEGYATGASIHAAIDRTVIVAFDAGNLKYVVSAIKQRYPFLNLMIAADNDQWQEDGNNTGLTKAYEVSKQWGCHVVYPTFGPEHSLKKPTDFNDLHVLQGIELVKEQLEIRRELEQPKQVDFVEVCHDKKEGSKPPKGPYRTIRGHRTLAEGVYYFGYNKDGESLPPLWLCSPLEVTARTTDGNGHRWGYLLEWLDDDKRSHCWPVPAEMLIGQGEEHLKILSDGGLVIATNHKAKDHLIHYIRSSAPDQRARCTDHLGWHDGAFVLPDKVIGEAEERIVYEAPSGIRHSFAQKGTMEEWRQNVALPATGNSRAVFAISCAFAPVLLKLMEEDSGGFNLYGESSSGKTTLLRMAASVWGSPSYVRRWRATANGLEGLAQQHNDGLLILDELAQVNPKEAGESAYTLGNGSGKTRCSREGIAKKAAQWRLLYLSSGEITLSDHVRSSGNGDVKAGQEIRLVDIPVDAGQGMGAFENLHDSENASDFSRKLTDTSAKSYGTAGIAFVEAIIDNLSIVPECLSQCRSFVKELMPPCASGQVERVAMRFALVALAGELAASFDITGWNEAEAANAVKQCFNAWLNIMTP